MGGVQPMLHRTSASLRDGEAWGYNPATKKSKKTSTFKKSYLRNIGKQVAPGLSFSNKSTKVLSDLAVDFYSQLIKEQNQLVTFNKNSKPQQTR